MKIKSVLHDPYMKTTQGWEDSRLNLKASKGEQGRSVLDGNIVLKLVTCHTNDTPVTK